MAVNGVGKGAGGCAAVRAVRCPGPRMRALTSFAPGEGAHLSSSASLSLPSSLANQTPSGHIDLHASNHHVRTTPNKEYFGGRAGAERERSYGEITLFGSTNMPRPPFHCAEPRAVCPLPQAGHRLGYVFARILQVGG